MITDDIKKEIISVADNSSTEIILKVYQYMINKHESFCDCDYCHLLRLYVNEKKRLNKIKKWYYDYDFYETEYENLKQKISLIKWQKDNLKKIKI